MFAVGICAGGGYMARAVAAQPLFCAFAALLDTTPRQPSNLLTPLRRL